MMRAREATVPVYELLPLLQKVEAAGGPWQIERTAAGWACTVDFSPEPPRTIIIWSDEPLQWAHMGVFISALLHSTRTTDERHELCEALKIGFEEMLSVFVRQREVLS